VFPQIALCGEHFKAVDAVESVSIVQAQMRFQSVQCVELLGAAKQPALVRLLVRVNTSVDFQRV
jgi:hypothetical protein